MRPIPAVLAVLASLAPLAAEDEDVQPRQTAAPAAATPAAPPRQPVPPEAVQGERLKALREIYKAEYGKRRAEEREALARKLVEQGLATADDLAARYVFLREAADLATRAGDAATAQRAVEAIVDGFAVDGTEERLRLLGALAGTVATPDAARAVIERALAIGDAAVAADDYPLAGRAAGLADRVAVKLRDPALAARSRRAVEDVKMLAEEFAAVGEVRDLLGQVTPAASARYGRFLCFAKGDWQRGLEYLAQGDDEALKALATAERAAATAEQRAAAADGWYDWAVKQQKPRPKREGLLHAAALYRAAQAGLSGLAFARVDKRLGEIEKAAGVRAPRVPDGVVLLLTFEAGTVERGQVADLSPQRHVGRISGNAVPTKGPWGVAMAFDGLAAITIPNHASLQTAQSMTLAMWLQPAHLGARRNPWHKSYGGECTWTLEPGGDLNAFFGTAGADEDPYAEFNLAPAADAGQWAHLVFVRDAQARSAAWYRNGALVRSEATGFPVTTPSNADVTIGNGYAGGFVGLIDEVGLWPRALTAAEITALHATSAAGRK